MLTTDNSPPLTLTGVAAVTGIPRRSLYRMLYDGRFDAAPIVGRRPRRWTKPEVERWLARWNGEQ